MQLIHSFFKKNPLLLGTLPGHPKYISFKTSLTFKAGIADEKKNISRHICQFEA